MDERILGLLYDLASAVGRMHGRLLVELTEQEAIDAVAADSLLRAEEAFIAELQRLEDCPDRASDPLAIALLRRLVEAAAEPIERSLDAAAHARPPPPPGPAR